MNARQLPLTILLAGLLTLGLAPASWAATTYYVSESSGSDNGDGQSSATAWKTLARASEPEYAPGDSILLKCGNAWNEELRPQGEGTAANPINIGSYGDGPRPVIDRQDATGNNIDKVCIRLKNIAGYRIEGIEFVRFGRGVFVDFDKGVHGKEYVWIEDCYFHDALYYNCTGWYTADIPSDGGTGPDYVFDVGVWVQTRETEDVICLSDITVKKCRFERVACAINLWSGNEWDKHAENRHEFKNVVIDQCTAEDGKNWQFVVHSTLGGRISNSWGPSANANTKNKDTVFDNCVFNAKETWRKERNEKYGRSGFVFCEDRGNTATIRNSRFYLVDGETLMQHKGFTFSDCVEIVKSKDVNKNVRLAAKATASSFDHRHQVANATDKNAKTAWRSDSGTSAGEWLEVDFGEPRRVDCLVVDENEFSSVSRFAIQTWDTKTSRWRDCFNGGTIGPEFHVTIAPVTTRKFRLVVHRTAYGSPGINEIEAYNGITPSVSDPPSTDKRPDDVFNDSHEQITYSDWITYQSASEIGGDERYTNVQGASCQFTFSGTGITWIGVKNLDNGEADVYLDGTLEATVDTYSPKRLSQQELFKKTGLPKGEHTIKVVVKGTKNPASKDCYVVVDAFRIAE